MTTAMQTIGAEHGSNVLQHYRFRDLARQHDSARQLAAHCMSCMLHIDAVLLVDLLGVLVSTSSCVVGLSECVMQVQHNR